MIYDHILLLLILITLPAVTPSLPIHIHKKILPKFSTHDPAERLDSIFSKILKPLPWRVICGGWSVFMAPAAHCLTHSQVTPHAVSPQKFSSYPSTKTAAHS